MPASLKSVCRLIAGPMFFLGLMSVIIPTSGGQTKNPKKEVKKDPPKVKDFIPDRLIFATGGDQVGYINELVEKQWKANKMEPSERCDDYTFIRRLSLDLIGRIAKPHEIAAYMADPAAERRSRLIERLLESDEFTQNFGGMWTVHLLTRSGSRPLHQEQLRDWLSEKLTEKKEGATTVYSPDWSQIVTELITATGRTNENGAVNFILHHMGEPVPQAERPANGTFDMVPITSRTTRLFLGLRTQCVQCHDHPFQGEWGQHNFWGINAFFRQTDAPLGRPAMMAQKKKKGEVAERQVELVDNATLNPKGTVFFERRNTLILPTGPTFLDGRKAEIKEGVNRRKELAKFVTTSPYFAKAFVNRTWGHFFGKSFTKDAVDDFGEHNPVTNPELLDRLSEDWAKKFHHNPKDLIRWICNSRAYSLSSVANKTNDKPEDEVFFSRMLLKSMSPEQLFDSLMIATQAKVAQAKDSRIELRQEWLKKLIANFGDDEGNEVSYNGTVVQALILINGKDINDAIMDVKNGTVAKIIGPNVKHRDAMKAIYMAALNRPPTELEYTRVLSPKVSSFRPDFQKTIPMKSEAEIMRFWTGFYQDMMWAVLNTSEFIMNH